MDTSSTLSPTMKTFYHKSFLDRVKQVLCFEEGAQKRVHPNNEGATVRFTRFAPRSIITAALSEGVNPTPTGYSATNVDFTFAEYGDSSKLSRFVSLTSIDENNKEKIEVLGQQMGESRDARIRNALVTGGTITRPVGATNDITTTSAMKLDAAAVRLLQAKLKKNKAMRYPGKYSFKLKGGVEANYDLSADQIFVDFQKNNANGGEDMLRTNKIGGIYNTEVWETTQPTVYTGVGASGVDLYGTVIHGMNSFGVMDLEGDKLQQYIVPHTKIDSGNAAGRFGLYSWAGAEASGVLNPTWVLVYKHAGSTV